jgi:CBS domain-containing protein
MQSIRDLDVGSLKSEPVTVVSTLPVSKVIGTLKEFDAYEAFVVEASRIGMVTMRDLLRVKNVLTRKTSTLVTHVPKLAPEQKVGEAARIMSEYRIRALPIMDGNNLVGVIQARSILTVMKNSEIGGLSVDKAMMSHLVTVDESTSAMKARNLMIRRDIDHLPVVGSKGLRGMLNSSHIVFNMIPSESPRKDTRIPESQRRLDMPVKALMDQEALWCNATEKITAVLDLMMQRKVDYCLVKVWEELQGILTYRDLMSLLVEKPETQVPVYMVGLPEDPFEAEAAKTKFTRIVNMLSRTRPSIEEARSKIKSEEREGKERRRYEVSVVIKTTKRVYNFSETGWDLPAIYDIISSRLKRLLTEKQVRKRRDVRGVRPGAEPETPTY